MMTEFARGYDKVGSITVLGGEGASQHIAAESAAGMRATFDTVEAVTGIDLRQIIQGQAVGRGMAQGMESGDVSAPSTRRAAARANAASAPSRESAVADAAAAGTGAAGADLTGGAHAAAPRLSDPTDRADGLNED